MRKKILYLMHVPWGWIKQRPHYLAEKLSTDFTVDVYYKKPILVKSRNLKEKKNEQIKIKSYLEIKFQRIPILKKLPFLNIINTCFLFFQISHITKYDYIWITSPSQYKTIHKLLKKNQKIIYDCMDDYSNFPSIANSIEAKEYIYKIEKELIKNSNLTIFSAEYLKDALLTRYNLNNINYIICNNAIELPVNKHSYFNSDLILKKFKKINNPFVYIGTIEKWFDLKTIIKALNDNSTMNIVLFGPLNITLPSHPRIHYFGTIKRDDIFKFINMSTALIMPFIINDLIKSVNPVKLYEYIMGNKPILAPKYEESLKFSKYVYLYKTDEEFSKLCKSIIKGITKSRATNQENEDFILKNTWDSRHRQIIDAISLLHD